jgi:hypothetical protein
MGASYLHILKQLVFLPSEQAILRAFSIEGSGGIDTSNQVLAMGLSLH